MTHDQLLRVIRRRMKALELGPYELARRLDGRVSQSTVYNFVKSGKPARSDTLMAVLTLLGLVVVEKEAA